MEAQEGMMTCEDYAKLFNLYLDKELSKEDVRLLEGHLAVCQDCFGHIEFDRTLRQLMKSTSLKEGLPNKMKFQIQEKLRIKDV